MKILSKKPKIIVIVGPTAVGKTSLSIQAAHALTGEVISGDSMQIYTGLDIGTAKVTAEEAEGVVHHLIDVRTVEDTFTAADFKDIASQKIEEIIDKTHTPIIVGGTGLYIESLLYDLSLGKKDSSDNHVRAELQEKAEKIGKEDLWNELKAIDPKAAETIHPNNVRRVIRALEVFETTGVLFSEQKEEKKESPYDFLIIGLRTDRSLLYDRIDRRVDLMMDAGLLEEAKWLWEKVPPDAQAAKGIGYKELFPYFEEEQTLEEVSQKIKQHSRNYAKRQLTWFQNRMPMIHWYDLVENPEQLDQAIQQMRDFIN